MFLAIHVVQDIFLSVICRHIQSVVSSSSGTEYGGWEVVVVVVFCDHCCCLLRAVSEALPAVRCKVRGSSL